MIDVKYAFESFKNNEINFFTGIPDSLLKEFCAYVTDNSSNENHIISANEGGSIGIATGYHLATGKVPLVYLQNSGIGNCINPLLSLADKEVYGIPMILMIGWRGEPMVKDEPQHIKQGRVQNELLEKMEIPYIIIDQNSQNIENIIKELKEKALNIKNPVALVVKKNTFSTYKLNSQIVAKYQMTREDAIKVILNNIPHDSIIVSTTGMASREVFEQRVYRNEEHNKDFLTVGAMGHCSQIALGVSLNTKKKTICLDGDGAVIMHLGSMPIIGQYAKNNFIHIVLNNSAHDSVGGQPTVANLINLDKIASSVGYKYCNVVESEKDLISRLSSVLNADGSVFIEVRINKGSRKDLGRPTSKPIENKEQFMNFILQNA
jgi:phosphonopyruvate decarboxylase